ncbi:MAG: hypothetical protein K0S01_231 [Herbinix sp.]|jgi:hypothetical protein|nr:hypothetical protein [Herbinix sp.]
MVTMDGKWVMEGLDRKDSQRIKSSTELSEYINDIGFLPLFKNNVKGFSVEEMTATDSWWAGKPEEDPWEWREVIAAQGEIAYGKLFSNRAGFISKEWYPYFADYRRDGYDFDSRYEDGLASIRAKKVIDVLTECESLPSNEIKAFAGFGKGGEKGFEGIMSSLQMMTYITVRGFQRRRNKKNEEYGWSVAIYCLSEKLFGEEYVRSAYHLSPEMAKERIIERIINKFPDAAISDIEKNIR